MRFAKAQEKKMGKPDSNVPVVKKQGPQKSPISKAWISTSLSFLVNSGLLARRQRKGTDASVDI